MKKPFNLRLPVLWVCSLILGIVYSALLLYFKLNGIYTLLPAIITFSACIPVAILTRRGGGPFILFSAGFFLLVGVLYTYARGTSFGIPDVPLNGVTQITGRVSETGITANGVRYAVLSGAKAGGVRLNGKVIAYLSEHGGNYFRVGYRVNFFSQPELNGLVEFGDLSYYACKNYKYRCFVAGELTADYRFSLFGEIYNALESTLSGNLDRETAAVCLALITGNTESISSETLTAFRNGGIAHVFAVSGLHIGVIFAILSAAFKKMGVNRIASAAVRVVIILFYAGVCGFSPSSVRAVAMCSSAVLANCVMRKNDSLNSLALSALALLLINPFQLFDVGFALSYGAVLGILVLSHNLNSLLGVLPTVIRRPVVTCLAVQLGTIPTMLTAFGTVAVAGIFLNVLVLPVISVVYVLLFVCTVLSTVFPFLAGALMYVSALPVQLLTNIIASCGLADTVITADVTRIIYLPFIAVTVALTDKLNYSVLKRTAVFFTATTALTVGIVLSMPKSVTSVTFSAGYNGGSVMIDSSAGTVLIITSDFEPRSKYYRDIDALIVVGKDDHLPAINLIDGEVKAVYLCGAALYTPSVGTGSVTCSDNFTVCGINFTFDNTVLYFDLADKNFAVERAYLGDMYGGIVKNCDFILYSYHNYDAVLYSPYGEINLAYCGDVRYEIRKGKLMPASVSAREYQL